MKELMNKLAKVQSELKAPKGQRNSFGNYNYRSCEDILEAVKPLLAQHGLTLTLSDEVEAVGDRVYVKAIATVLDGKDFYMVNAYAREAESKKGMDSAQITGAASSYARKYALNGLFAIDDTKDADATNKHDDKPKAAPKKAYRGDVVAEDAEYFYKTGVSKKTNKKYYAKEAKSSSEITWMKQEEFNAVVVPLLPQQPDNPDF